MIPATVGYAFERRHLERPKIAAGNYPQKVTCGCPVTSYQYHQHGKRGSRDTVMILSKEASYFLRLDFLGHPK
jgi:hypothetical protein